MQSNTLKEMFIKDAEKAFVEIGNQLISRNAKGYKRESENRSEW
jgi:hypothetical protein